MANTPKTLHLGSIILFRMLVSCRVSILEHWRYQIEEAIDLEHGVELGEADDVDGVVDVGAEFDLELDGSLLLGRYAGAVGLIRRKVSNPDCVALRIFSAFDVNGCIAVQSSRALEDALIRSYILTITEVGSEGLTRFGCSIHDYAKITHVKVLIVVRVHCDVTGHCCICNHCNRNAFRQRTGVDVVDKD